MKKYEKKGTWVAKPGSVKAKWLLIDAEGQILGRLAVRLATILQGKHRPTWTPHVDTGDFVVLINAAKVKVTGRKEEQRTYTRWTGYPSGLRMDTIADLRARRPDHLVRLAVRRMMPKTILGRKMLSKLKIYAGTEHPHKAQKPESV